jgi:microcystin-dependent protein
MAYTINKFNGETLIVLDDGTIDTSTSLGLVGRNYVGYGETQNENFIFLLENFANDAPPSRPLQGQIWYNNTNNLVYVYNGTTWAIVGSAVLGDAPPEEPTTGALWLRTPINTLNVWTGSSWAFIGPESVPGFGTTRARSGVIEDSNGNDRPVIFLEINESIIGICSESAFTVNPATPVSNFNSNFIAGINLSNTAKIGGSITGNATSADRLSTARFINNVAFDGQSNITITSSTTNRLTRGEYLTGSNFNGSEATTWSVDATSSNVIGKIVVRNSEGGFAAGTITANLVGNLTGNVSSTGTSQFNIVEANQFIGATLTGNAFSASQLEIPRKINGVNFNATQDITITAAAGTLTGNTLNSTVTTSTLTSVGTLVNLNVNDTGINVGSAGQLQMLVDSGTPTIRSITGTLNFDIGENGPDISFVNSPTSLSLGGPFEPAILGDNTTNLGITGYKFNNIYANNFLGNATTSTLSTSATNLVGGGLGAIPYQTAPGTTSMLGLGAAGTVLTAQAGGVAWATVSRESLTKGSYVNLVNTTNPGVSVDSFTGLVAATISVDATTTNTASKVVARDASGNFAAGTITANLTGNVTGNITGNAGTATRLQTSRTINGVAFDGTANITIEANDPNSGAPVGSILYYPSSSIPVGWMMCDGSAISTSIFSLLFSKIGYNYGGSGSVFRLPDLRGEFIRSWDGGRGVDAGRTLGSTQSDLFRSHQHLTAWSQDSPASVTNSVLYAGRVDQLGGAAAGFRDVEAGSSGSPDVDEAVMFTTATGGSETRPRNVALVACIKVFGEVDEADQVTAASVIAYVNSIPNYVITSGNTVYSTSGFTNQVGSWNNGANYFDVFPPAPKTMSNLAAFIPSIAVIHYAGAVNGDDSMRCTWSNLGDRIRVYVQNTEQRSTPAANFMAIWS